jgi:vanillate O-demethylase ferredoxin subunit
MIAVKREENSRGVSRHLHDALQEGDTLHISRPRNNFPLVGTQPNVALFAAGIGITPMIAMARRLMEEGQDYRLHYFVRSVEHAAFRSILCSPPYSPRTSLHVGLPAERIQDALENILSALKGECHLYGCGPRGFLATLRALSARNPSHTFHMESFDSASPPEGDECASFTVYLSRSGREVVVPADKTILETLESENIAVKATCRQGCCGSCLVGVVRGRPKHRDTFLTEEEKAENDAMCVCVSRGEDGLVLDL